MKFIFCLMNPYIMKNMFCLNVLWIIPLVLLIKGTLTLTLLTCRIWRAPTNASKCQMGFNSAFKGLNWR